MTNENEILLEQIYVTTVKFHDIRKKLIDKTVMQSPDVKALDKYAETKKYISLAHTSYSRFHGWRITGISGYREDSCVYDEILFMIDCLKKLNNNSFIQTDAKETLNEIIDELENFYMLYYFK